MAHKELHIITVNCKSLRRNWKFVSDLCNDNDVILLQETWLLPTDLHILQNLHPECDAIGSSSVDTAAGPLVGRPYGGMAIIYKKSLKITSTLLCDSTRLSAVEIALSSQHKLLLINVYMPVCKSDNLPEFADCLCKMHSIVQDSGCSDTLILGDFNADPTTLFGKELMEFCGEYNYVCIDPLILPTDTYTFVSDAHGTVSWLDHCLSTEHNEEKYKNCDRRLPGHVNRPPFYANHT
ncbi:hypothetical protein O0L34_g12975 [Tuta absoluta]|nr:hypothetical protein O0L34_g12975 [Tuta absoluta]